MFVFLSENLSVPFFCRTFAVKNNVHCTKILNTMDIQRPELLNELVLKKHNELIKIITGMRRSGKSYLLNKLFVNHLLQEGVPSDHIISVDLELLENLPLREPVAMLQYITDRTIDTAIHYVIIDEVQHLKDFEELLNTLLKKERYDVYVTGSNSRFLIKDVITIFRGRGDELRVYPFSFREFASAYPQESFNRLLQDYLLYGGMPQVCTFQTERQKVQYLSNLFENTYLTDIKERNHIRNDADLSELLDCLASSVGSLTSPYKLQKTFQSVKQTPLSYSAIKNYFDCLQDAFVIEQAKRYDIKGRRYIDSPQKYYFSDLGLRNARIGFRQTEPTHLFENLVYNELRRMGYSVDVGSVESYITVNSVRQHVQTEVDFVCNLGYERVYVQVAYMLPDEEKRRQELRPLNSIKDNFKKVLVVADLTPTHQNEDGVLVLNIFDFLNGKGF